MQAVISGQAGVALLVEGNTLSSIHAGKTDEVVRRRDREIPYLFGDARDFQFLEDVELPEVAHELELATTKADALHIALILLDPQLTHDTRREAAEELAELLEIEGVLGYVEAVLYSRPIPGDGDLPGALLSCAGRSESVRQLLLRLGSFQGEIASVYEAWEQIPDHVFGSAQDRRYALATVVRAGLFRDFVGTLAFRDGVGEILERTLRSDSFLTIHNHREILERWASTLQRRGEPSTGRGDAWAVLDKIITRSRHPKRVNPLRILYVHDAWDDSGDSVTWGQAGLMSRQHASMATALQRIEGIELATHRWSTLRTLRETLRSGDYQVVHFLVSYSHRNDVLHAHRHLEAESVEVPTLSLWSTELASSLRGLQALRLVFLDACFSGQLQQDERFEPVQRIANQLVQSGIPSVVALQHYVEDQVADTFIQAFYPMLAAGRSISDAMDVSYRVLSQANLTRFKWAVPVLYQRAPRQDAALGAWKGRPKLGPWRQLYRRFRRFWRHRT